MQTYIPNIANNKTNSIRSIRGWNENHQSGVPPGPGLKTTGLPYAFSPLGHSSVPAGGVVFVSVVTVLSARLGYLPSPTGGYGYGS